MLIHSKIYKKYYPVKNWMEIQMLDGSERQTLARHVRKLPRCVELYTLSFAMKAKGRSYLIREEKLPEYLSELSKRAEASSVVADKVEKGAPLDDKEIRLVNDAIYARKYNGLWTDLFNLFPTTDDHYKAKREKNWL